MPQHPPSSAAGAGTDCCQELADLAERLFDAALATLQPIERMPAMGTPRLGQLCEIPGLRSWRLADFPLQWLYFEAADHLDVVRLLGDRQDIAAILTQSD